MASQQFDASPEQIKLAQEKAERRAFLRNEFLKQKTNPFEHASGHGGTVFDSAYQRYQAMRANGYDYFKTSPKQVMIALTALVIPMAGYTYLMYKDRNDKEASYRRGEVAYKDRRFKFC